MNNISERRSTQLFDDVAPSNNDIVKMLSAVFSAPDHKQLKPYRFILVERHQREDFYNLLHSLLDENADDYELKLRKIKKLAFHSPVLIIFIGCIDASVNVPVQEQIITAGLACYNVGLAANGLGYGAFWTTGFCAYDDRCLKALKIGPDEFITGYLHIGPSRRFTAQERETNIETKLTRFDEL